MSNSESSTTPELEKTQLEICFIPIICSAPLIYAHRHGFFEKNELNVNLRPAPGWSGVKALIVHGQVDAVHMLSPMPLSCSLGIDGKKADIRLATVQNVNGGALTLAKKHLGIKDVRDMKGFTFGVPYRFSMHYYLLCHLLANNGLNPLKDVTIREVAPPRMPYYIEKGWVDGVFAPEPFNQISVYRDIGFIYILSKDIWPGHPCCSFATRQDFMEKYPHTYRVLLKSVLEAELALHRADPEQRKVIAREICGPQHLNQDDPVPVEQALAGDFPDGTGAHHKIPDRIDFIPYPWEAYGNWILSQMQRWAQLPAEVDYREVVESVFQTEEARELAEAIGFAPENKPSLEGVAPFTGDDPFAYMMSQPYTTFQERRKAPRRYGLSASARARLSQIIEGMAKVAGGKSEFGLQITSDDELGLLEQTLNEMFLNTKFAGEALAEQTDRLEERVKARTAELTGEIAERKRAEKERERLLHDMDERIKELRCMYGVAESIRKRRTLEEVFQDVVALIPLGWHDREITRARIRFDGNEYVSAGFEETEWRQSSDILVGGEARGLVEVFQLEPRPELDEGPFLKEERNLIDGIAQTLSQVIEREQTEQALRESEEKHRVIAQAAQDAIIVADATGAIRFWNPAAEMIFGYSAEEIVGRDMIDTIVPPQYHQAKRKGFAEFVKTGRGAAIGKTLELTALRKDRTEFPIEISVSAYEDSEGFRAVAVVRDVTERKNAEERLRESNTVMTRALEREKRISASLEATMEQLERARQATEAATRSKSEFLANMSHEIRTPMTAILGFADVLLEQGNLDDAPPERVEAAEAIGRNGEYLLGLLNDILDLSKIEAGKMTVERVDCSLCRTIAEVASLARVRADAKGLAFNIEYLGAVPEIIQSDPTRLRQILINLIGNAIKFSEVGSVQLVTRFVGDGPEPLIQFDMVDTGIGMTAQQVAGLFQPFTQADASTTRKYGGTGLGLTISQRLAELLGGEITVIETAAGVGTRMRVSVPTGSLDGVKMIEDPMAATVATPTAAGDAARTDERPLAACRILLAEDGPDNQRLIVHMLKKAGAQVTVVENGSLVVDVALAAHDDVKPFDVILMDMQMPVIDGYRATRLLRQKGYTAPIVALTAHAMASDREKCIQAGCNDYTAKPINRKKLIETIRKHLPAAVVS